MRHTTAPVDALGGAYGLEPARIWAARIGAETHCTAPARRVVAGMRGDPAQKWARQPTALNAGVPVRKRPDFVFHIPNDPRDRAVSNP